MNGFNESEWIRLLFLIADTRTWMDQMEKDLFQQVPMQERKKLFRRTHFLTAQSMAHILERHYSKINRHPGTGKFTISVVDILHWIREAGQQPASPLPGSNHFIRCIDTNTCIGYDKNGQPTTQITLISDASGCVRTAFPGTC